jgi:hypothetical protein
MMDA